MEERTRDLIRRSWAALADHRDDVAPAFYARLFTLDPGLRDLFAVTDMSSQHEKFVLMLDEILRLVGDPEAFEAVLKASGARHREYGVVDRHYRTVGEALLSALDGVLPDGLDDETRAAWAEAYTLMSRIMQSGASVRRARRSPG